MKRIFVSFLILILSVFTAIDLVYKQYDLAIFYTVLTAFNIISLKLDDLFETINKLNKH